jgi:hypothetical protein
LQSVACPLGKLVSSIALLTIMLETPAKKATEPHIYELYGQLEKNNPHQPRLSGSEAETIRRVLRSLQKHERERLQKGFNRLNFTVGVLNTLLIAWVFGAHPEHFWLLFLVESSVLLPLKIYQDYTARPMCQVFYYLDYCWVMNFLIILAFYALMLCGDRVDINLRHHMFTAVLGVGCGSLLGATGILPFAAVVFHDSSVMTSLFVHLVPPMLLHTFLWNPSLILQTWPTVFHFHQEEVRMWPGEGWTAPFVLPWNALGTVVGDTMIIYWVWFVLYVLWMLTFGLELTRTKKDPSGKIVAKPKYDTVYYSLARDSFLLAAGHLWGRKVEVTKRMIVDGEYEYRDFALYMTIHACLTFASTVVLPYACQTSRYVHSAMIWGLVSLCVFRGASRYVYWVTSSSSRALTREYRDILEYNHNAKKKL